jgi:hypothetical protein
VDERILLQSIIEPSLAERKQVDPSDDLAVAQAVDTVGVDLACVENRRANALQALETAGFSPSFSVSGLTCLEQA